MSDERKFKGIWIPAEIWESKDLTWTEKLLLAEIDSLSKGEDGCFATNEYFCDLFDLKERRVQQMLQKLKGMQLISLTSFNGRKRCLISTIYNALSLHPRGAIYCTPEMQSIAFSTKERTKENIYNINYNNNPIVPKGTSVSDDINFSIGSASVNEQQTNDVATALTNNDLDNKFEELWKIYTPYETREGHSVGKGAKKLAKDKFVKTVAKGADPDDIIQGTRLYIADCHRRKSLTKNVPTFLNQEQWKDYLDQTDELPIPVMPMGLMFRNADLQNTDPETYMDLLRTEWKNWSEYAPNWVPVEKTPEMALELAKRVLSSKHTIAFSNSILDTKFWAQHRFEVQFLLGRVRWLGILFGALGKHIPLTE